MARQLAKGYHYLFADRNQDEVRLGFPTIVIEKFIERWNQGVGMREICYDLKIKEIEFALIAMSLHYSCLIKERKRGIEKGA